MVRNEKKILTLNAGSSSLKFAVYRASVGAETLMVEGALERIGLEASRFVIRNPQGASLRDEHLNLSSHKEAMCETFTALERIGLPAPDAVGHRIVQGGSEHESPEKVGPELLETLERLVPLAPLHLPAEIRAIEAVADRDARLPQVACFDTAFHRRSPELAQRFPLPRRLWHEGVRRYGFHGISYEYILDRLGAEGREGKLILAHLGNGASMVAVRDGSPLETTMGLTPTGGIMMGSRSGDLDPGVVIYLMREHGLDVPGIERLVDRESGLLGVSGMTSDMRTLLKRRDSEPHAAQAIAMFSYHARKAIGALAAVLGGVNLLVFTGGIGENAAPVRGEICEGLGYLGIHLAPDRNGADADTISTEASPCAVRVVPTNEDLMIARHTYALLFRSSS